MKTTLIASSLFLAALAQADALTYEDKCRAGQWSECSAAGRILEQKQQSERAAELYALECEKGRDCFDLLQLANRVSVAGDLPRGTRLIDDGCNKYHDENSCTRLIDRYLDGDGVAANPKRAAELAKRGCEHGQGCGSLAWMYRYGVGVAKDPHRAEALEARVRKDAAERQAAETKRAREDAEKNRADVDKAEQECLSGKAPLSCSRAQHKYTDDLERTFALQMLGCKARPLLCPTSIADEFAQRGDAPRGLKTLSDSCDRGAMLACGFLGDWYEEGRFTPRDFARAAAIQASACDDDFSYSCIALGNMYYVGAGVPVDHERALALRRKGHLLEWQARWNFERLTEEEREKEYASMDKAVREAAKSYANADRDAVENARVARETAEDRKELERLAADLKQQEKSRTKGDRLSASPLADLRPHWKQTIERLVHDVVEP
jgi:TPR repeat protein